MIGTLAATVFGAAVLSVGQLWVLDHVFKTSTAAVPDDADRSVWESWCTAMMLQDIGCSAITALILTLAAAHYLDESVHAAIWFVLSTTATWLLCTYRLRPHSDNLGLWNLQVRVILGGAVVVRFAGRKGR